MLKRRTIGQVAKYAGVGVETIRYYERRGLIAQPDAPAGGFREYPDDVVDRVRFIRHAKDLGFTLQEIGELLSLQLRPRANCATVKRRVEQKISDVETKVQSLKKLRHTLLKLAHACDERAATDECPVLESLH